MTAEKINIYEKLQKAKKIISETKLKKTGKNAYAKYDYYDLSDFMPTIIKTFEELKLYSKISFTTESAILTIINSENPQEKEEYLSPMVDGYEVKGHNAMQLLGGIEKYQRRYLYMAALDITENDALYAENDGSGEQSAPSQAPQEPAETKQPEGDTITSAQAKVLFADTDESVLRKVMNEFGYKYTKDILKKDFDNILKKLIDEKLRTTAQRGA